MDISTLRTDPTKTARDLTAMAHAGAAVAAGAKSAAEELAAYARRRYRTQVKGLAALMACRTPGDLIAAQAGLICEDIELMLASGARMAELVAATAGGAVRSLDGT